MAVGATGLALGLALDGPKLIRTVGNEITELDKIRAFCIAMAAAITVTIVSQLGSPVSSTHIAVGGVFGVGFLREYIKSSYAKMLADIQDHHADSDAVAVEKSLAEFENADVATKGVILRDMKAQVVTDRLLGKQERRGLRRVHRVELVKRNLLLRIAAAFAAMFFFMIRGIMLP